MSSWPQASRPEPLERGGWRRRSLTGRAAAQRTEPPLRPQGCSAPPAAAAPGGPGPDPGASAAPRRQEPRARPSLPLAPARGNPGYRDRGRCISQHHCNDPLNPRVGSDPLLTATSSATAGLMQAWPVVPAVRAGRSWCCRSQCPGPGSVRVPVTAPASARTLSSGASGREFHDRLAGLTRAWCKTGYSGRDRGLPAAVPRTALD
jgi:hypothetical protein